MRKQVLFVASCVAFAWGFSGAALAADYSPNTSSHVVGKPFPWGIAGERWAELVKEKTGGRINIRAYPGTSWWRRSNKEFTAIVRGHRPGVGSTINWSLR